MLKKFLGIILFMVLLCESVFAGWEQVAGNYFYKDDDGNYLKSTTTPDGYVVNEFGIRVGKSEDTNNGGNSTLSLSSKKAGDVIKFGSYYIDSTDEKDDIEWVILKVDKTKKEALLLSKYVLAIRQFNDGQDGGLSWENSSLRTYLNGDLYNECFDNDQKAKIINHKLDNKHIYDDGATGGNNTNDNVFLLSEVEYEKYVKGKGYFPYNSKNTGYRTNFAKTGKSTKNYESKEWLRAPMYNYNGSSSSNAPMAPATIGSYDSTGTLANHGFLKAKSYTGIRPAIYVSIN